MDCHNPRDAQVKLQNQFTGAGGQIFKGPWGASVSRNLTPDETGLKSWSDEKIAAVLKTGLNPGGVHYQPPMAFDFYKNIHSDDFADQFNSPAYPKELKARARINERIDWFNSNFYKDIGYGLAYPQLFAHHARPDAIVQQGSIEWAQSKTKAWLAILNTNLIGDKNAYLCGDQITLCDYFGIELVLIGELVGSEYEAYPNIKRWMNNMKQLKNWTQVHAAFDGFAASLKGKTLIRI
jgi:hypothetical protein